MAAEKAADRLAERRSLYSWGAGFLLAPVVATLTPLAPAWGWALSSVGLASGLAYVLSIVCKEQVRLQITAATVLKRYREYLRTTRLAESKPRIMEGNLAEIRLGEAIEEYAMEAGSRSPHYWIAQKLANTQPIAPKGGDPRWASAMLELKKWLRWRRLYLLF